MGWIAFGVLAFLFFPLALFSWRKWIDPWRDVEELAQAVVEKKPPRKFLISANPHSRRIGLALETLTDRQREIEERLREGESSVQAVFGAMLEDSWWWTISAGSG